MIKRNFLPRLVLPLFLIFILIVVVSSKSNKNKIVSTPTPVPNNLPTPTPSPTPTPKPLTFSEMNTLYGPCITLPTFMYHHIQDMTLARTKNQQNLTVDTVNFQKQMQYLKDKGYQTLAMSDLINFFSGGASIPRKSVLLTFDDGYDDFYLNAYPILSQLGFKATMFTPTGLIGNPGYLSWNQIGSMSNVLFANHTWSHKNMNANGSIDEKEISLADTQLMQRGYDNPKVFAYPYGSANVIAENLLSKYGYTLAFTTKPGNILCKKQSLILPRVRIGNISLGSYGF